MTVYRSGRSHSLLESLMASVGDQPATGTKEQAFLLRVNDELPSIQVTDSMPDAFLSDAMVLLQNLFVAAFKVAVKI